MAGDIGDDAEDYLSERAAILGRLKRVNELLAAWTAYEANERLPPELKRALPRPELLRTALGELHEFLEWELRLREALGWRGRCAEESGR